MTPTVLLPAAAAWTDAPAVGLVRSSGFHPQAAWPGRKVRRCGRCESVESRIDLPHCTPRRHIGADEARDWPRRSGRGDHPDRQTPEPLIVGALPGIPSPDLSPGARRKLESLLPTPRDVPNLGKGGVRASAAISLGYGVDVQGVWTENSLFLGPRQLVSTGCGVVHNHRPHAVHIGHDRGWTGHGKREEGWPGGRRPWRTISLRVPLPRRRRDHRTRPVRRGRHRRWWRTSRRAAGWTAPPALGRGPTTSAVRA